ncbi:MAG: helix-turn-helix transcriptional regulator [Pseudomonadota bacterium]
MDQKQSPGPVSDPRAEAALELLRSLANAGDDPDQFAQACLDWSRLSEDATSVPDFLSVLALLSDARPIQAEQVPQAEPAEIDPADVFSIDLNGVIARMPKALSNQFGINEGDPVPTGLSDKLRQNKPRDTLLAQIPDRFGIKRQVRICPVLHEDTVSGFIAYAMMTKLAADVRIYLREHYGLTTSEIEILQLVMQRHSLDQIAEIRGGKLNTVRTHVSRLNSKLDCHSLVEAVSTVMEVSNALKLRSPAAPELPAPDENTARRISLETPETCVEYRRYGSSSGHPVVVLHSVEYGYIPSQKMIEAARARHLNLIFPVRPGFGETTCADSLHKAADLMAEFIRVLKLEDVTLVGLSTAAPLALLIQDRNARIGQTLLVNYGLNVADKLKGIQPSWIRGLLRMALNSPASFTFGFRTLYSMLRTFGGQRFYRMLYRNQSSDLTYVEDHLDQFATMANYIAQSDRTNARLDIQSAFLPNPDLESILSRSASIRVINGADQHGIGPEESQADAERLGVEFRLVEHPGRNWMFQHPEALFSEMLS